MGDILWLALGVTAGIGVRHISTDSRMVARRWYCSLEAFMAAHAGGGRVNFDDQREVA